MKSKVALSRAKISCLILPACFLLSGCMTMQQKQSIAAWNQLDPRMQLCLNVRNYNLSIISQSPDAYNYAFSQQAQTDCISEAWAQLGQPMTVCLQQNVTPSMTYLISQGVWPNDPQAQDGISKCQSIVNSQRAEAQKEQENARLAQERQHKKVIANSPTVKYLAHNYPDLIDRNIYGRPLVWLLACFDNSKDFKEPKIKKDSSGITITALFRDQYLELDIMDDGNFLQLAGTTFGKYQSLNNAAAEEVLGRVIIACSSSTNGAL